MRCIIFMNALYLLFFLVQQSELSLSLPRTKISLSLEKTPGIRSSSSWTASILTSKDAFFWGGVTGVNGLCVETVLGLIGLQSAIEVSPIVTGTPEYQNQNNSHLISLRTKWSVVMQTSGRRGAEPPLWCIALKRSCPRGEWTEYCELEVT